MWPNKIGEKAGNIRFIGRYLTHIPAENVTKLEANFPNLLYIDSSYLDLNLDIYSKVMRFY